jgi:hypothetical protein
MHFLESTFHIKQSKPEKTPSCLPSVVETQQQMGVVFSS